MFTAFLLLLLLIGATPVILIFESFIFNGLVAATLAAAITLVARTIRPGEASYLSIVLRPVAIVGAVPAIWLVIQILPLKSIGLSHPIWTSAEVALGRPVWGGVSVDIGATFMSLCRYLSSIAILFLTIAVAIDRRRAEWVLFSLLGSTVAIAAVMMAHDLGGLAFLSDSRGTGLRPQAMDAVALGVILAAVSALKAFERYEAQRTKPHSLSHFLANLAACFIAFTGCTLVIVWSAADTLLVAIGFGLLTLLAVAVIRRFSLGPWGYAAIASAALILVIAVIAIRPGTRASDITLAFATGAPGSLTAVTQRVLAETPWLGTGAGTFAALLPIYRDVEDVVIGSAAPTAAAAIAVELGRPMLVAIVIAAIIGAVVLLQGALQRGRDSFYPAAGASCVVTILLLGFANSGFFGTAVSIIVAAILGLAIAQSKSRKI